MADIETNFVNFSFLDAKEERQRYTVLIILNRPIIKEFYLKLFDLSNFIICADGAANRLFEIMDQSNSK